jgi:hypothetical protein
LTRRGYLSSGASEGRMPNQFFDSAWYLRTYPDVANARVNPLAHYASSEAKEGRDPHPDFSGRWYLERARCLGSAPSNRMLSITTTLGSGASPQARRKVRRSRSSIRRQRPAGSNERTVRVACRRECPTAVRSLANAFHRNKRTSRHDSLAKRGSGERWLLPDRIGRTPSLAITAGSVSTSPTKHQ